MPNYTLSYNKDSSSLPQVSSKGGWPSFYSFFPDFMIGMNSFYYSFKGGNIWRHNTNETRNSYYDILYSSTITSVFNPEPTLSIKLFKTLSFESNTTVSNTDEARWACTSLFTDLTDGTPGSMLDVYFEEKEGEWFSFIRTNEGVVNFAMRSATGIALCTGVSGAAATTLIEFASPISTVINIGDSIFSVTTAGGAAAVAPSLAGIIIAKTATSVTVNVTGILPAVGQFIISLKNSQAESHGARGYFLQFKLENDSTSPVELFAVGSSVMKSYP